jgi:hypothetical protein
VQANGKGPGQGMRISWNVPLAPLPTFWGGTAWKDTHPR